MQQRGVDSPQTGRTRNAKGLQDPFVLGYPKMIRMLSLACFLLRALLGATTGRYSALIVFGATSWDYYVVKTWNLTKLPSFYVVHDGKMHEGEQNNKIQRQIIGTMKMSTHLVFLSNYVRNMVKKNYNVDKPCLIVPHGLIDYGKLTERNTHTARPRPCSSLAEYQDTKVWTC